MEVALDLFARHGHTATSMRQIAVAVGSLYSHFAGRLREMRSRGSKIVFGHDPDLLKSVPQAPTRLG